MQSSFEDWLDKLSPLQIIQKLYQIFPSSTIHEANNPTKECLAANIKLISLQRLNGIIAMIVPWNPMIFSIEPDNLKKKLNLLKYKHKNQTNQGIKSPNQSRDPKSRRKLIYFNLAQNIKEATNEQGWRLIEPN